MSADLTWSDREDLHALIATVRVGLEAEGILSTGTDYEIGWVIEKARPLIAAAAWDECFETVRKYRATYDEWDWRDDNTPAPPKPRNPYLTERSDA